MQMYMSLCMYRRMYRYMYLYLYTCMFVCLSLSVCMYVCMQGCTYVCIYVCILVWMYGALQRVQVCGGASALQLALGNLMVPQAACPSHVKHTLEHPEQLLAGGLAAGKVVHLQHIGGQPIWTPSLDGSCRAERLAWDRIPCTFLACRPPLLKSR